MKSKSLFYIAILLVVLLGIGTVSASENVTDVDMTLGDSNSGSPIPVDNWADLKSYCESTNDQIICLNGSFSIDSQIEIKNNINIIGDANYYIGGTADNVDTYSSVPFLCSDALNVTFTNVNFQYTGGKNLMQFSGNGNYKLENCNFDNLNSGNDNSIIWSNYGIIDVNNCSFSDCTVKTGVIYNYYAANSATTNNARLYVTDSRFRNNYASSNSGAILNGGYLFVDNSTFEDNYAFWWAGAIHTGAYANTTIYNSNFTNNLADWNGGALYTYSNLQIYNCNFISNNCTTNNGGGAIGACKVNTEPNVYVFNSTFKNNINNCKYYDNTSTTGLGRGGAISIMDDGVLKAYNNTFIENGAKIGSAICAISQGSYGSPDVEIVGNKFINHTGNGDDLIVVSLSNSNYLVENNTYSNNKISIGKFRLDIDDNNGDVTVNVTLRLKHPEYYDADIVTKSGFEVYLDGVYYTTIHTTTFTHHFNDNLNHNIKIVPLCLYNEFRDYSTFDTIYVSTTGNDNNNGATRTNAVRTISRALQLAQDANYIKILEGTYYERSLTVPYDIIIEGEGNVILVGNSNNVNTFNVNSPSVVFSNLKFTGITGGKAITTQDDFIVGVNDCSFYSNNLNGRLIDVYGLDIKDSIINNNIVYYAIYVSGILDMKNCNVYNNNLTGCIASSTYSIVYVTNGKISNSTFINNKVNKGVIYINGNNVTIQESKFISNNANFNNKLASYGGAIYGNKADNIIIDSSIFYNNYAYTHGGAIYLRNNAKNLNITNSVLIGNNAKPSSRNYQIDRYNTVPKIFAINNWWGNTIDNAYVAPTFYSNTNVNASIWLILNVTSNVTSLNSGESAVITFDLTYTNILGSDSNDTNIPGNLTPFCIDGTLLPVLEGLLTATNGYVNGTDVTLVDGKLSVLFTATNTNSYLTIDILEKSESIYFYDNNILRFNDLNKISMDSINTNGILYSKKSSSDDLLGYGYDPAEYDPDEEGPDAYDFKEFAFNFYIYKNCWKLYPSFLTQGAMVYWLGDETAEEWGIDGVPDEYYEGEENFHINISYFNSTLNEWQSIIEDSFHMPCPEYDGGFPSKCRYYLINGTTGLYNFSFVYDGQEFEYEYEYENDDGDIEIRTAKYIYKPDAWEATVDLSLNPYESEINGLNDMQVYYGNNIKINPSVSITARDPNDYEVPTRDDPWSYVDISIQEDNFEFDDESWLDYNPEDFPENKPVNITMTVTQGDKVVKNFSVAPGSTYSLEGLAAGEYNLTAVYDDPYYGYATKTVTISVYGNHIWETGGADMGYSHQIDYYGPKNVKELWNMSINNFQGPVIDFEGNIYIASGRDILVLDNDGNVIRTIGNVLNNPSKGLLLWKDLIFSSVFTSWDDGSTFYRINDVMSDRNYNWIPTSAGNMDTSRSWYAPVYSNDKIYFVIPEFDYGLNDYNNVHLLVYNADEYIGYQLDNRPGYGTITKSSTFAKAMEAPSIDSEGYIYVNTKSGLVILDPELNILDLSFGDAGKYGRPVIDSLDMVYVFNSDRTKVYALNRETGLEWNTTIADGACGVMAVDVENNALYIVGNDGILYKLNRANGEMSEFYNLGTNASSILVDARGTIYLGGTDGVLYAVTNEGKTLFKYNIGGTITKDMVLDDNGTLYVYADTKLYALGGAPKLFSEILINVSDVEVNRNSTIVATLPEDAQGNVTFIIDDTITSENVTITDGNATWTAPGLLSGPHTVKVTWVGDSEYFGSEATKEFNAYKVNSTIDLEDSINYVGKLTQLNITLPSDANGFVNVTFNRKTESVKIVNGTATFETTSLEAGNYAIDFSWEGDERYFGNAGYAYFTVIKNDASLTIDAEPIKEGEDLKVTVTLSDDERGMVLIMVGDVKDFAEIKDGKAEFTISGLTADTYDINATYLGDNKYYNTTETSQVTVSAKDTATIEISPEVITEDDNQSIEVTLPDDATGNVLVEVNGNTFYAEVNGGKINVPVSGLKANTTYPVTVTYSGNDIYSETTEKSKVTTPEEPVVEPKDSNLKLDIDGTVITVSINDAATGDIIVTVGDIAFVQDASELAPIDVSEYLSNGTYSVTVKYVGDDVFANATQSGSVTVPDEPVIEPKDPNLKVTAANTTITVTVNKDAAGYVVVEIGDVSFYAEIENGKAVIDVVGLEPNTYAATVSYSGDGVFKAGEASVKVTVPGEPVVEPKDPGLKATVKETVISVSVNKDATGYVLVDVDGQGYYAKINDGKATVDVSGLDAGDYTASVTYLGDGVFKAGEASVKVTVPEEPVVELKDPELKATVKETVISISVNKDATGYVLVDVDGQGYYAEIKDGKAVIEVIGLDAGTYTAVVSYAGDDVFGAANATVSVAVPEEPVVEPKNPNLKATAVNNTITVTVDKDASGNVLVDVDGQGYYATINDGKAVIEVIGLDEGKYQATVNYLGDDVFKAASATVSVTVPKKEDTASESVDPKAKMEITNTTIGAELPKDATGYVLVDVDGTGYYVPVKDGKASFDLPELAPGNHTVTVTYAGDKKYDSSSVSKTIAVVNPVETIVSENLTKIEKSPDRFVAKFSDKDGKALANTKVTFAINGGSYTRTTDANGVASFAISLPAGTYTMITTNPVTGDTKENSITVLSRFVENRDVTKYFRNATQYVLKVLGDDGKPAAAGEVVTFNINGVFYNRTVNATGHVKMNINLNPGNYVITAEYKGCKVSNNIKVLPVLTGKDLTKKFGEPGQFEATLVDGQGKAYANQKISFNINGVFYERTTNANGIAKLNINLQPGVYIITSTYGQASISNKVTVTA